MKLANFKKNLASNYHKQPLAIIFICAFAFVGVVMLLATHAATNSVSIEAEAGVLTAPASQANNANASGGKIVKFGTTPVTGQSLSVNAAQVVRPFDRKIKGFGLANWTFQHGWGKPFVGEVQGLSQAVAAIDPGIIRYAGGLWANYVGFDRTKTQILAYTDWTKNGNTYSFDYGTDELASLDSFAKSVNADVMIQVNISQNDPSMWADLVRYAKEKGWTSFKYYEFGNELDLETANGNSSAITPAEYSSRLATYQTAMLAVDPSIRIVGGVPASGDDVVRNNWGCCGDQVSQYITQSLPAAHNAGRDLTDVSFHWYQGGGATDPAGTFQWTWGIPTSSTDFWRQSYSRQWSEQVGPWIRSKAMANYPNTKLGLSELGPDSGSGVNMNGNHVAALWYSDVLGRLAYNGIDWITQWDSYAASNEIFNLFYPNSDATTTPTLNARPTYDAYLMYSKYFGDQMVQTTSFDQAKISIWASKDSKDPNKLKLRITNLTGASISAPINLSGFSATSGSAYTMSSTNPLDLSDTSITSQAPTTINGVKINANNVAASLSSIQPTAVSASGNTFNYNVPAYSSVAIVLSGSFQ